MMFHKVENIMEKVEVMNFLQVKMLQEPMQLENLMKKDVFQILMGYQYQISKQFINGNNFLMKNIYIKEN